MSHIQFKKNDVVEMEKVGDITWGKQCYNCKKIWHDSNF